MFTQTSVPRTSNSGDLLILDELGTAPIVAHERNDLLEFLDDLLLTRSTPITSQLSVAAWHAWLDEPTLADAILDRMVHSSLETTPKGWTKISGQALIRCYQAAAGGAPRTSRFWKSAVGRQFRNPHMLLPFSQLIVLGFQALKSSVVFDCMGAAGRDVE